MVVRVVAAAGVLLGITGAAHAAEISPFLDYYLNLCVLPAADFATVDTLAKLENWSATPEELLPLVSPSEPPLEFGSWSIPGTTPMMVSVSVGSLDGQEVHSCALAGDVELAEVRSALMKLGATLLGSQDQIVQTTEMYILTEAGNKLLASLVFNPRAPGMVVAGISDVPDNQF